ncbi:hypothetical protein K469DRAFT_719101 [Zopfia rhizophila CBS 207.26]|uniref:Uncharacterized protein n=1 Tax=Zopfia rhizophila CBS 207.26 TaxID=1314779 RepID=A0A6A6EIW0_9PEZI|nr:hypothetical protein K469DRAFT_719101 [Zopfia rhizophila CBS 207.26]
MSLVVCQLSNRNAQLISPPQSTALVGNDTDQLHHPDIFLARRRKDIHIPSIDGSLSNT